MFNNAMSNKLKDVVHAHIMAVFEANGFNRTKAARELGIGIRTIQRHLKRVGWKDGKKN